MLKCGKQTQNVFNLYLFRRFAMLDWGDFAAHSLALQVALTEANEAIRRAQTEYEWLHKKVVQLRMSELEEMFPQIREM